MKSRQRQWMICLLLVVSVWAWAGEPGSEAEEAEAAGLNVEPEVITWGADRSASEALAIAQEMDGHKRGIPAEEINRPSYRLVPFGLKAVALECSMLRHCLIELGPGESLSFHALSDGSRWSTEFSSYGAEDRLVVAVKPMTCGDDVSTLLTVGTNQRLYQLVLRGPRCEEDGTVPDGAAGHVRFYYPDAFVARNPAYRAEEVTEPEEVGAPAEADAVDEATVPPEEFDFEYRWRGSGVVLEGVFNDGTRTYFRLAPEQEEVPVVFDDEGKDPALVNYRFSNGVLITDRVLRKALLRVGAKRLKVVYSGRGR